MVSSWWALWVYLSPKRIIEGAVVCGLMFWHTCTLHFISTLAREEQTSKPRVCPRPAFVTALSVWPRQVVLLTSREDPVVQSLADKLAKRMDCLVVQVGKEPRDDLYPMMEQRKLNWKDVAYMGKTIEHL